MTTEWVGNGRPKVFVTRLIPQRALAILEDSCDVALWPFGDIPIGRSELVARASEAHALLTMLTDSVDRSVIGAAQYCKIVANMAVGYDNIDLDAARARHIEVTNTPGVLTEATADLVWALTLATARRIVEADSILRRDGWTGWSPEFCAGVDLVGGTLGIVGAGRIGTAVAMRAAGFQMNVVYHNRSRSHKFEKLTRSKMLGLRDLLQVADVVVCLVPGLPGGVKLFGADEFSAMKCSAIFVNAGRGSVVDEAALYEALTSGEIFAAGLDVFANEPISSDHPLASLSNVVLTPHIGSATLGTRTAMAVLAARNIDNVLVRGLAPLTPVTA